MGAKKRILHIIQSLDNGGCENMLLRTLPLLQDFEHHIITLKNLGELASEFSERGISVTCIHHRGLWDMAGYRRLLREIRGWKPAVLITYLFHADMIGRLFIKNKIDAPVVAFLRTTYNDSRYIIARLFERITSPLAPRYLANSQVVKRFYLEHFRIPENKITVIENGLDIEALENALPHENIKRELGIGPLDVVLICVANLLPNKGHRYLLEAFERVSEKHGNLHLLLVGDGVEKKNLRTQLATLASRDKVHFLGKRTDVPSLLKAAHIFVLPTLFEGMSNALLEAMAAGVAIITTDIAENREILENEKTGILVKVADAEALDAALQKLLESPLERQALAQRAQETVRRRFSLIHVSEKWKDYLTSLTSQTL